MRAELDRDRERRLDGIEHFDETLLDLPARDLGTTRA